MSLLKPLALGVVLLVVPPGRADYRPPPFDGRVGPIVFENTSLYPVCVTLWHPDSGHPFGS